MITCFISYLFIVNGGLSESKILAIYKRSLKKHNGTQQIWSNTTVLLVLLGFLAPVECNRPANCIQLEFLLSSTVYNNQINKKFIKMVCSYVFVIFTGGHLNPESK